MSGGLDGLEIGDAYDGLICGKENGNAFSRRTRRLRTLSARINLASPVPLAENTGVMVSYEDKLNANTAWAIREGSRHFENDSSVHRALRRITKRLDELQIPYALAGGMALFLHGYRRFTEDVDILVSAESLNKIHANLEGLGYVSPFEGSKNLRDTVDGVRIEFLVQGQYPGDGKPKEIAFPNPQVCAEEIDGIQCLNLPTIVQLKLASGTIPSRLRDLGDVQELIRTLHLPENLVTQLHPSVQASYLELWKAVAHAPPDPHDQ